MNSEQQHGNFGRSRRLTPHPIDDDIKRIVAEHTGMTLAKIIEALKKHINETRMEDRGIYRHYSHWEVSELVKELTPAPPVAELATPPAREPYEVLVLTKTIENGSTINISLGYVEPLLKVRTNDRGKRRYSRHII